MTLNQALAESKERVEDLELRLALAETDDEVWHIMRTLEREQHHVNELEHSLVTVH